MSYGVAAALQAAIYQRLSTAAGLVGMPLHDAIPPGGGAGSYLLIGPEDAVDQSDKTGRGAEHRFTVSVISDADGFHAAKVLAGAVSDSLVDAQLALIRGRLVGLRFVKAVARRRDGGQVRRIDLTFRARVEE